MTIISIDTIDNSTTIGTLNKRYEFLVELLGVPNISETVTNYPPRLVQGTETTTDQIERLTEMGVDTDKYPPASNNPDSTVLTKGSWAFEDNQGRKGYIWARNRRIALRLNTLWSVNGDIDMLQELFNNEIISLI